MINSSQNCKPKSFYLNFGTNIFVHILFLFSILTLIFTQIVTKLSSEHINHELSELINHSIDGQVDKMNPIEKNLVLAKLKENGLDKLSRIYDQEDKTRKYNNSFVFSSLKNTIILLITTLIIIIVVTRLLCYKLPMKHIIIENIIIFTGIGIIEYMFFTYIILKYIPVEPSFITKHLLQTVKKNL